MKNSLLMTSPTFCCHFKNSILAIMCEKNKLDFTYLTKHVLKLAV